MNEDPKKPVPEPAGHQGAGESAPTSVVDTASPDEPAPKDESQEPKENLGPDQVGVRPPDHIDGKDVPGTDNTALIFERS